MHTYHKTNLFSELNLKKQKSKHVVSVFVKINFSHWCRVSFRWICSWSVTSGRIQRIWRQNWRFLQGTGIFGIPDAAGTFSDLIGWNGRIHCGSLARKKENEYNRNSKNTFSRNFIYSRFCNFQFSHTILIVQFCHKFLLPTLLLIS